MKSSNSKNLVYVCFADKENNEILNCLKELRSEYNFELDSCKIGEPCNPKTEFQNKVFIFCCEKEDDLRRLQQEHDKYLDKLKNQNIILCCPFECSTYKSKFDAKYCINSSNVSNCKNEFKKIFDNCFQSFQQGKVGQGLGSSSVSSTSQQQTR
jgi:hypothetical protein